LQRRQLSARTGSTLRLSSGQTQSIVAVTHAVAGVRAVVKLFGFRLDDQARGGDIDLLVEVPDPVDQAACLAARITASLQRALGDRKVDVLLVHPHTQLQPVHLEAQRQGVLLK